eukprot:1157619-Pelagomonas_calceolata.AAC.18
MAPTTMCPMWEASAQSATTGGKTQKSAAFTVSLSMHAKCQIRTEGCKQVASKYNNRHKTSIHIAGAMEQL